VDEINQEYCGNNGIRIVRRITGGKAVLHDKEITYSIIIDNELMPESVIESYKELSKGLLEGLKILGLNAVMNEKVEKKEKSPVCFSDPSWYEIVAKGKKIIGSAQKRVNGKILQHGAILIDLNFTTYANCFLKPPEVNNLKERITTIKLELGKDIKPTQVKDAIILGFKRTLNIKFKKDRLTNDEKMMSIALNKNY
jgi:lipoyl(octanoyl) transferase